MAMLHPTYNDLIKAANKSIGKEDQIKSRYSIVLATSKRARQIIDGAPRMAGAYDDKPLTAAIDELDKGMFSITTDPDSI